MGIDRLLLVVITGRVNATRVVRVRLLSRGSRGQLAGNFDARAFIFVFRKRRTREFRARYSNYAVDTRVFIDVQLSDSVEWSQHAHNFEEFIPCYLLVVYEVERCRMNYGKMCLLCGNFEFSLKFMCQCVDVNYISRISLCRVFSHRHSRIFRKPRRERYRKLSPRITRCRLCECHWKIFDITRE